MQQPTDQSVDQKKDVPPCSQQYLDIVLVAGQYKIYCPAMAFDPPKQSVIYRNKYIFYPTEAILQRNLLRYI